MCLEHAAHGRGMLPMAGACCPWQGHAAHGRGMLPMAGACCPWQGHAAHGRGKLPMAGASPATTIYESVGWRSRRIVVAGLAPAMSRAAMSRAAMPRAAMSLAHVTESQQYVTESQRRSLVS